MNTRLGKIKCRVGRHQWRCLISSKPDEVFVIRICIRCYSARSATMYPAVWITPRSTPDGEAASADRPIPDLGSDGL